jgi:hypothetical protein
MGVEEVAAGLSCSAAQGELASPQPTQEDAHELGKAGVVAATMLATALSGLSPTVASASTPERFEFSFANSDTLDCGAFQDVYTDSFEAHGTAYFDASGAPKRIIIQWEHHSNDTNSLTGLTLHEHGNFTETIDFAAGTDTVSGNQEIMNRSGSGVVVQDVGRIVYDQEGNVVFFAGGRKHSELLIGDQVLCDALA